MKAKLLSIACITLMVLGGCATPPDKIEAAYVSPVAYEAYTCEKIGEEATRVSQRAVEALGQQKKTAQADAVKMGVALVLFWPAALAIKGDGANEHEVARLKGEMEALEAASVKKNCGIHFEKPEAPDTVNEAANLKVQDS